MRVSAVATACSLTKSAGDLAVRTPLGDERGDRRSLAVSAPRAGARPPIRAS
jgi:hypothetical protein